MAAGIQNNRTNLSVDKPRLDKKRLGSVIQRCAATKNPWSPGEKGREGDFGLITHITNSLGAFIPQAILPFFVAKYDTAQQSQSTSYQDSVFPVLEKCSTFFQQLWSHMC